MDLSLLTQLPLWFSPIGFSLTTLKLLCRPEGKSQTLGASSSLAACHCPAKAFRRKPLQQRMGKGLGFKRVNSIVQEPF